MKKLVITDNGEFNFPKNAYDAATYYVAGTVGGATISLQTFGVELSALTVEAPVLIVHGAGAPLRVVVTGGSGVDLAVYAYPVE